MVGRCGTRVRMASALRAGLAWLGLLAVPQPAAAGADLPAGAAVRFELPWITGESAPGSAELFSQTSSTMLVVWNRSCPRCTRLALQCDALADSLRPSGVAVYGLLFGPDDPAALETLLEEGDVETPHLWDASGTTARGLGLGLRHLALFLFDAEGSVRAAFGDTLQSLLDALPSVREVMRAEVEGGGTASAPRSSGAGAAPGYGLAGAEERGRPGPMAAPYEIDGRMRLLSTEGAAAGDHGLLGEPLEPGTLLLYRWDLKWHWRPATGIEFVPWLRLGNEEEAAAAEGAEQFASRYGTATVSMRRGRWTGSLGAFPLEISPLLFQRWDREDAPPLGGVSGCGVCAAGAAGIGPRSLEVLGPEYTLEGLRSAATLPFLRLHLASAVPRWEQTATALDSPVKQGLARYRKVLGAAVIDLGPMAEGASRGAIPAPFHLRVAALDLNDDRRTVDFSRYLRPVEERDESALSLWVTAGPWRGLRLEGEQVWWKLDEVYRLAKARTEVRRYDARAVRAGGSFESVLGRVQFHLRLHRIRTDPRFEPFYRALTYHRNREGWRAQAGVGVGEEKGGVPTAAFELFYRGMGETQDNPLRREYGRLGRMREEVASVTVLLRPTASLQSELHLLRAWVDPPPTVADDKTRGISAALRWSGWPAIDPAVRFDLIRREADRTTHTIRQASLWVRVLG